MSRILPYMQFHVADWMSEPTLRMVSHEAKGLWVDILCLMWTSPERGVLLRPDGKRYTDAQLSRAVGYVPSNGDVTLAVTLQELIEANVCDVTQEGALICRRMVREQRDRENCARRVRDFRWREKAEKKEENVDVTHHVTDTKRREKQKVTPLETETDTETDTDTEREREPSRTPAYKKRVEKQAKCTCAEASTGIVDLCDVLISGHPDMNESMRMAFENLLRPYGPEIRAKAVNELLLNYAGTSFDARNPPPARLRAYLMRSDKDNGSQVPQNAENDPIAKMNEELKKQGKGKQQ